MPRLINPPANSRVPYAVVLDWTEVAGAAAYNIQVAGEEEFLEPRLVDDTASQPPYRVDLPVAGPLWWRVRALDARGRPGPWSAVRQFDILPPPLAASVFSITLTPSSVPGGEDAEGLVTLNAPAPEGGATVLLSNTDPEHASLPPRVLFPTGETSATFSIATEPVAGDIAVRVYAGSKSDRQMATLTIVTSRPHASLSSLAVRPAIVAAGAATQGTVRLAGRAPFPTVVQMASADESRAAVPATVNIPAGAWSASFPVTTVHDSASGTVTLTASLEGVVKSATLNVRGAAATDPLDSPSPLLPRPGSAFLREAPVEFAWSDLFGAVSYTIEVASTGSFTGPLVASRTVPASRLTITPLPPGTLWWRVRANDENGAPGRWSPPSAFRVSR